MGNPFFFGEEGKQSQYPLMETNPSKSDSNNSVEFNNFPPLSLSDARHIVTEAHCFAFI